MIIYIMILLEITIICYKKLVGARWLSGWSDSPQVDGIGSESSRSLSVSLYNKQVDA